MILPKTSAREVFNALYAACPKLVESCITVSSPSARSKKRKDTNNARTIVRVLLKCAGHVLLPSNVAQFATRVNTENDLIQKDAMRVFEKLKSAPRKVKAPKLPPVPKEQEDAVMAMGFSTQQARVALRKFKNDTQQAVLWLLSTPIASSGYQEAATMYQDRDEEEEGKEEEEEDPSVKRFKSLVAELEALEEEDQEEKVAEENEIEEKEEEKEEEETKPYAFGRGLAKTRNR